MGTPYVPRDRVWFLGVLAKIIVRKYPAKQQANYLLRLNCVLKLLTKRFLPHAVSRCLVFVFPLNKVSFFGFGQFSFDSSLKRVGV